MADTSFDWDADEGQFVDGDFIPIYKQDSFINLLVDSVASDGQESVPKRRKVDNNTLADQAAARRKRELAAAACRATRAKKKQEKDDLRTRNEKLEKDREIYLAQIAQLQTEVQTLRDVGSSNLKMENELLRAEINKHKGFVQQLVSATKQVPESTIEEKYRYIKSGIDSAIGQVVGLCYTSCIDENWIPGALKVYDNVVPMKFQLLPLGVTCWENTRRANFRVDMPKRHENVDNLRKKFWRVWTEEDKTERLMRAYAPSVKIGLHQLPHEFSTIGSSQDVDGDLEIFHYTEEDKGVMKDSIFILTAKHTPVFDKTFPLIDGTHDVIKPETVEFTPLENNSAQNKTVVICCSSSHHHDRQIEPERPGVYRLKSTMIEGHVLRPAPDGGSYWTMVLSMPYEEMGYAGFTTNDGIPVDDDQLLTPEANNGIKVMMQMLDEME